MELVAQRPRLVRSGERIFVVQPEIADAAALGEQHDRTVGADRKRDVADRAAQPRPRDVLRTEEEIRHDEFAPDARNVEVAAWADPDRPYRITLFVLRQAVPRRCLPQVRAARHRIVQAEFITGRYPSDAEAPHPSSVGRKIPAFRRILELARRTILDPRPRRRIEGNGSQLARLLAFGVQEIGAARNAMIVKAEIGAVAGANEIGRASCR